MNTTSKYHPRELMLDYLEGRLDQDKAMEIKTHLDQCDQCAGELRELKDMVRTLKNEKGVHCPEPWELQEYWESQGSSEARAQDRGEISAHLKVCPLCSEELELLKQAERETEMPQGVRAAFKRKYVKAGSSYAFSFDFFRKIRRRMGEFINAPALAMGTVAAVALLILVIAPDPEPGLRAPMTSVDWTKPFDEPGWSSKSLKKDSGPPQLPGTINGDDHRAKVAVILLTQGDRQYEPQWVDSLYRAIRPRGELAQRFRFLTPASLGDVIQEDQAPFPDIRTFLERLSSERDIPRALLMTVMNNGASFDVENILADTRTGKALATTTARDVPREDLPRTLRSTVFPLLDRNIESGQ